MAEFDVHAFMVEQGGTLLDDDKPTVSDDDLHAFMVEQGGTPLETRGAPKRKDTTRLIETPTKETRRELDIKGWGDARTLGQQHGRGEMLKSGSLPPPSRNHYEDEDAYNKAVEEWEEQGTTFTDVVEDAGRVLYKVPLGISKVVFDILDAGSLAFTGDKMDPEAWPTYARNLVKNFTKVPLSDEDVDQIIDEHGKIREIETSTGQVLNMAEYMASILTGKQIAGKGASFVSEGARWLAASVAAGQVLADPDANLANLVEGLYGEDAPDSFVLSMAEYVSADEDDTTMEKRAKLLVEEVLMSGVFGAPGAIKRASPWVVQQSKSLFDKLPHQLKPNEKREVAETFLEEARSIPQKEKGTDADGDAPTVSAVDDVVEGQNILKNADSRTRRVLRRFFTSRGAGLSEKAFAAFEKSRSSERATLHRAVFLSEKLKAAMDNIITSRPLSSIHSQVKKALESDLDFLKDLKGEDRLSAFARKHDLPDEVAHFTLQSRDLIDEMSIKLTDVSMSDELREVIQSHVGSYLTRAYKLIENPNWTPSDDVRKRAVNFIADSLMEADELAKGRMFSSDLISREEALSRAANQVDDILGRGTDGDAFQRMATIRKVNREIFQHKGDIPKEIRELMGEIQDPSESVLHTISKMSKLYETNRFFDRFYALGKSGKYVIDPDDMPVEEAAREGWVKVEKTNSILDGKYAPSHVVDAIHERDAHFKAFLGADGSVSPFWRNFLYLKGQSQQMKTIYSHVTHIRNILGGAQHSLANGANPLGKDSIEAWKVLRNRVAKGGDEELQKIYEEYLELGLINTSVRANEFKRLIEVGSEGPLGRSVSDKLDTLGQSYGGSEKALNLAKKYVVDAPKDIYMASDDFFKIGVYQQELRTLKKAYPDRPISELKSEAAIKVRDTMPNYDRVPRGIQAIRELPLGNFVAYPTEIIRTTLKITRLASQEITSGNPVLRNRGLKRLSGLAVTTSGWYGLSEASAHLMGWSDEEAKAHHILSETPYSQDSPRVWVMTHDGVKAIDTQFLDSYSTIKEPIMAAWREIETGQLHGKDLDEYLLNAAWAATLNMLQPYASQSMLTEAITDIPVAATVGEGRTPGGKMIFNDKLDSIDQVWNAVAHTSSSLIPGGLMSLGDVVDAVNKKPNRITGDVKDTKLTLLTQVTGLKFSNHEPADQLIFAGRKWRGVDRNIDHLNIDHQTELKDLPTHQYNIAKKRFRNFQEFHRKFRAASTILGENPAALILHEDAGLSEEEAEAAFLDVFKPRGVSENLAMDYFGKSESKLNKSELNILYQLQSNYMDMQELTVYDPFPSKESFMGLNEERVEKNIGGIVEDVPSVPKEPDERIDKLTGRPYNEQAGGAFIDEEDPLRRLGFTGGGAVGDPLRRLGFGMGGEILKLYMRLRGIRRGASERKGIVRPEQPKEEIRVGFEEPEPTPLQRDMRDEPIERADEFIEEAPVAKADEAIEEAPIERATVPSDIFVVNRTMEDVEKFRNIGDPSSSMRYMEMFDDPRYFREEKDRVAEVVVMTPAEYIKRAAKILNISDKEARRQRRFDKPHNIKMREAMEEGQQFTAPYLDYGSMGQEGLNRAVNAEQLGIKNMPVVVITKVDEQEAILKSIPRLPVPKKSGKASDFKYATGGKVYNALRRRSAEGGEERIVGETASDTDSVRNEDADPGEVREWEERNWYQRAIDPNEPVLEDEEGIHTLLTASSELDGKEILYPTIREVDGKLKRLTDQEARTMALYKGDYLVFNTPKEATDASLAISASVDHSREPKGLESGFWSTQIPSGRAASHPHDKEANISEIKSAMNTYFPDDGPHVIDYMINQAIVESLAGEHEDTYNIRETKLPGGEILRGGFSVHQMDEVAFDEVKRRLGGGKGIPSGLTDYREMVENAFGKKLENIEYEDLRSPTRSTIFSRLFHKTNPDSIPEDIEGQASYWVKNYNKSAIPTVAKEMKISIQDVRDGMEETGSKIQIAVERENERLRNEFIKRSGGIRETKRSGGAIIQSLQRMRGAA